MMLAEVARAATNDVWLGVGCVDAEKETTKRQRRQDIISILSRISYNKVLHKSPLDIESIFSFHTHRNIFSCENIITMSK